MSDAAAAAASSPLPPSIAIAGAWGYIGRKFLDAALRLGIRTFVYDPGPAPADVPLARVERIANEEEFYRLPAAMYHLALHPEHRRRGTEILLARSRREPLVVLMEKPMAAPDDPAECTRMIAACREAGARVLYDFPELFDPITERILQRLGSSGAKGETTFETIYVQRSKDREDPANRRNYKRMAPIQYQESVHCLAFVLAMLDRGCGELPQWLDRGIRVHGESRPYDPPNRDDYPYVVDGRCDFEVTIGPTTIRGCTDFTRNAPFTKRRELQGRLGGERFSIEAEYLEGAKRLVIDGADQQVDAADDSYQHALRNAWRRATDPSEPGFRPGPEFAQITYQLSSALWAACRRGTELRFASLSELLAFDAGFAAAKPTLPRYHSP